MSSFVVAHVEVSDPEGIVGYQRSMIGTLKAEGGRIVAAGPATALEGEPMANMNVLIEFPDDGAARRWYESPAYQALIPLRQAATSAASVAILPGFPPPPRSLAAQ